MGVIGEYKRKLDHRLAERVFLDAQKDLLEGTLDRRRPISIVAKIVAITVIATPFLSFSFGAYLVWRDFPNAGGFIFGGLFMAVGIALVPRRARMPDGILRRGDLPDTFALLDDIAARIGTERITAVAFMPDCNAYMAQVRGERIVGIGGILWQMLGNEERGAVLAHELAHQANGDPARYGLTSRALGVLNGWLWYLEPDAPEVLTELLMYIPFLAVSGLYRLLLRLVYMESQRAEYLADAIGARAAGASGLVSSLQKLSIADTRLSKEFLGMHPNRAKGGVAMLDRLAAAITETPAEERERILSEARRKHSAIDNSHPPTDYRIAFLDLLPGPDVVPVPTDLLAKANLEIHPHLARIGDGILVDLQRDH